ncbi:RNA polymerase subunit sigma [Sphingomonas koreensis]|uniref:sigma-70 family RNA polymerase sigma factor n=1 Tax=Sphingomonas koreensis TaxID=93064 RepID=UPI00083359A1|nr:sigma-70 family RNA polymerase sigma factor [Sphingomonas koreensis]PJI88442.1 RNA polymerase sigma-70 factor (ECF subfamily) [Sphingomonas koreensis]RSU58643.1 RNA polymerase subunit sigma [Sphingomonas koreensis]RSU66808.1 RNA polymerase subunit sigma [Sphingomonas koreensis]
MKSGRKRAEDRERLVGTLSRVARGEQEALRELYAATASKLFGVCLRISHDREAAEDILQDVYLKVWNKAGRFDAARASPITWLCAIARNTAIDWRRANRAEPLLREDAAAHIADDRATAAEQIGEAQDRARIFHCLDALEARQGSAIRAAFFDGFTYAQLADRMKVPLGTMKSWVRRGLIQLRDCLGDD